MASPSHSSPNSEIVAHHDDQHAVQLVYDTWTPRPHFIAVKVNGQGEATENELQATYTVISDFLRNHPALDENAILSFHRGKWYQQHTGAWHAHLCVPEAAYLFMAKQTVGRLSFVFILILILFRAWNL